ncbi:MAG: EamA family transporter [Xanthomonadales bacterium]|nr:EamA family transporter [Xanthomonadales bacterium]
MSPVVLAAVLFAALLHAVWNALIKVSGDRLVVIAVTTIASSLLAVPFLFLLPFPAAAAWPYLMLTVGLHSGYMLLLVRAYGLGDFAQIYPLSRGSAPLLTALLGFLLLGETMTLSELLGMALIVSGIFALAAERIAGIRQLSRAALLYSLLTGVFITAYSLVDGSGARVAGNSFSYIAWLFFLDGWVVPILTVWRQPRSLLISALRDVWKVGLLVALLSTVGYAMVVWGFSQERIAPVAVLRETSVLFAMLISVFVLKERLSLLRITIVILIVSGIVLLGI